MDKIKEIKKLDDNTLKLLLYILNWMGKNIFKISLNMLQEDDIFTICLKIMVILQIIFLVIYFNSITSF